MPEEPRGCFVGCIKFVTFFMMLAIYFSAIINGCKPRSDQNQTQAVNASDKGK